MTDKLAEAVTKALRAHRIDVERRQYPAYACACGWDGAEGDDGGPSDGHNDNLEAAEAHLAVALVQLIRDEIGVDPTDDPTRRIADCLEDYLIDYGFRPYRYPSGEDKSVTMIDGDILVTDESGQAWVVSVSKYVR